MAIVTGTIRPPTNDGNTITIPARAMGYKYYIAGTDTRWTDGEYYIVEDTTIEIRPNVEGDTFPEGTTTSWTFTFSPETKSISIPGLILEKFNVYVNDEDVTRRFNTQGTMRVDTRILTKIEVKAKDEYFVISTDYPGSVAGSRGNIPLELNSERTEGVFQETEPNGRNLVLYLPEAVRRPYTLTFYGEHATAYLELGETFADIRERHTLQNRDTLFLNRVWPHAKLLIRADEGYHFTTYGTLIHGEKVEEIIVPISKENLEGEIQLKWLQYDTMVLMGARVIPEKVPTDILGFNNIYLVDKEKLAEISLDVYRKRRSYYVKGSGGGSVDSVIDPFIAVDPHSYIINTLQIPVVISEDDVGPEQPIELGFTKLLPNAPTLKTDKLTVDLGTIKVPEKYNNIYDYSATDVFIHLPYTNPVVVDPNYVIGHELSIQYIIDVYTGETTINLRSSLVEDRVIHSTVTYIGNVIPFITIRDATTIGSPKDSRSVIHNNTPTPYAEVVRKKPYQMDSQFNTNMRTTVDNLQDVTGRVYVHNISLDVDTTQMEVSLIKSILASGITIK